MSANLLIMAAGMGSRFGGLKQIEPIGPNGESILDFSVRDAVKAGFDKAVIVIKKQIEQEFRAACGKRIEQLVDVEYAFQELDKLPEGFSLPPERQKPWGTGHAVLCARDAITAPFAVINADDYYGPEAYRIIYDWLTNHDEMCMVGYQLGNTLTENGTVSRGVCDIDNGYLTGVTEHTALDKNSGIPLDTVVSMNMWGLQPDIFPFIAEGFEKFLKENLNTPKAEYFLPGIINDRIQQEGKRVRVLETAERWYGVTYREDIPMVKEALRNL
ncbi:MAG: nucleotidyltransferase [Ruminococcaceae bacterium]|nr:nucleotidyltransferase [Oscillospiraceae bacterium]